MDLWINSCDTSSPAENEYGDLAYPAVNTKMYCKNRARLFGRFRKANKRFNPKERLEQFEFVKRQLLESLESGDDERIVYNANLYIQILPKDSVDRKTAIYSGILFPIYYDRGDLTETYYICKAVDAYRTFSESEYVESECKYLYDMYFRLKESVPMEKRIEGLWISKNANMAFESQRTGNNTFEDFVYALMHKTLHKKGYPEFILRISERNDAHYATLSQFSGFVLCSEIPGSPCSLILHDSTNHMKLRFDHTMFKKGLSQEAVDASTHMVGEVTETAAKVVNTHSGVSSLEKTLLTTGINALSSLIMSGIADASKNRMTNREMSFELSFDGGDILHGEYELITDTRYSDASAPRIRNVRESIALYKIYPDDELSFAQGIVYITEPSRLAYLNSDYYNVFRNPKKNKPSFKVVYNIP